MARPLISPLRRFPALDALHADLDRIAAREERRDAEEARQRRLAGDIPPNLERVAVPWIDRAYWMSHPQREVIRVLTEALASRVQEVHESLLVLVAGGRGKLRDVFVGTPGEPALGELILPGVRAGHYKLAPPPAEDMSGEVRRIPVEE